MPRRRQCKFTAVEDAVLREHYAADGPEFCARRTGKTVKQVWGRAYRLGLVAPRKTPPIHEIASRGFDHRALAKALGAAQIPPRPPAPARVHRCMGGA